MTDRPGGYAGIVSRGIAFVVDGTGALVIYAVGFQFAFALAGVVGATPDVLTERSGVVGAVLALPVVFAVYCAGFWAIVGRTPGMMVLGLRVVKGAGDPPGLRRSVVRAVGYWVSAIGMLGFAWIAVDRRNQGFHDKLAGTFVVDDWGRGAR
jgi:uncharacterized RDD family membrane protein YckC